LQEWLTFIGTELHKNFGTLFNKAAGDDPKQLAKGNTAKRLGYVNDQLASRQLLLGGGTFYLRLLPAPS
jgi:glutathione S-transferase